MAQQLAPFEWQRDRAGGPEQLAIRLFQDERVSSGRAAQIAGLQKADFIQELGKRQIPVFNYPPDEVASDFRNA